MFAFLTALCSLKLLEPCFLQNDDITNSKRYVNHGAVIRDFFLSPALWAGSWQWDCFHQNNVATRKEGGRNGEGGDSHLHLFSMQAAGGA